ncbi:MAG: hypothetical protein AAF198_08425 [Pseudomonadota bacterium]
MNQKSNFEDRVSRISERKPTLMSPIPVVDDRNVALMAVSKTVMHISLAVVAVIFAIYVFALESEMTADFLVKAEIVTLFLFFILLPFAILTALIGAAVFFSTSQKGV